MANGRWRCGQGFRYQESGFVIGVWDSIFGGLLELRQTPFQLRHREAFPRTHRALTAKVTMPLDIAYWYAIRFTEPVNKLDKGFELSPADVLLVEVSDEADANAAVIEPLLPDVASRDLLPPTAPHLHLTILAARGAVINHKVVGKAVLHVPVIPVIAIHNRGVTLTGGTMVDHDILPAGLLLRVGGAHAVGEDERAEAERAEERDA
jgi:hypothetical protein